MRDHLAHRYFDTTYAILQATVGEDLPDLERAVQVLVGRCGQVISPRYAGCGAGMEIASSVLGA
jgi:hypothetical protein